MTGAPAGAIDVLVVDDSAVVRQLVTGLLAGRGMDVRAAPDPVFALDRIRARRPDVVLLDLEMPRMDGLDFLARVMASDPLPVVVFSSLSRRGTDQALAALRLGAVEVLAKPASGPAGFGELSATLVDALRRAAASRPRPAPSSSTEPVGDGVRRAFASTEAGRSGVRPHRLSSGDESGRGGTEVRRESGRAGRVVVVGASTGGPQALHQLLAALPGDAPGMVVAQHMPGAFTGAFARSLRQAGPLDVREAADGDEIAPGRVLVVPGGAHGRLRRVTRRWVLDVQPGPHLRGTRPSVDALFLSAAVAAGPAAVGVLLTGMGTDGAEGMLAMRRLGAPTIAQDEATSVVYGMPAAAAKLDAAEMVLPLARIPAAILRCADALVPSVRLG